MISDNKTMVEYIHSSEIMEFFFFLLILLFLVLTLIRIIKYKEDFSIIEKEIEAPKPKKKKSIANPEAKGEKDINDKKEPPNPDMEEKKEKEPEKIVIQEEKKEMNGSNIILGFGKKF